MATKKVREVRRDGEVVDGGGRRCLDVVIRCVRDGCVSPQSASGEFRPLSLVDEPFLPPVSPSSASLLPWKTHPA